MPKRGVKASMGSCHVQTLCKGVFLMLMYTYLMMLGEEWIHKGSQALFELIGNKAIGASVFRVLMALPRIVIVIEKRCESIYGFLPCADTMQEGVFLMLMYTYLMTLGEEWMHKGSQALFELIGNKALGASLFRVLMALPRIVIVIVSGVLASPSDARNQVAFSVNMYAGSTVITLTLIWGFHMILSREKLCGRSSTNNRFPNLSVFTETGVNIDKETGYIALIMLLSLIPFAIVYLVSLNKSGSSMILFSLIASGLFLFIYFVYVVGNPWIQVRSLANLKQEYLRDRFFYHVKRLAEVELVDEHGNPNEDAFKEIFERADVSGDGSISHEELEGLIKDVFYLQEDQISKDYAKAEIMTNFDVSKSGGIDWEEFKSGCSKWLEKWKKGVINSNSVSNKRIWKQVEEAAIESRRADLSKINKIMPRILNQVLKKHAIVNNVDKKPDEIEIERLFDKYANARKDELQKGELRLFISSLQFGVTLDYSKIHEELVSNFTGAKNNAILRKQQFINGFVNWINKAINHDKTIEDPKVAIAKFEEKYWGEVDSMMKPIVPKTHILYVVFGVGIIYLFSGAFVQSVIQFSNAANISFLLTSFVMAPIAMIARPVIAGLLKADGKQFVSKNASLTFSEIYNGLVMNNLLGLTTLLCTVYIKGLTWSYSAEVLTIMIPCLIIGLFAFRRCTYPLWASIPAMLLYPISVYLFYVLES